MAARKIDKRPRTVLGVTSAMVKVMTPGGDRPYHHVHVPWGTAIPEEVSDAEHERLTGLGVFEDRPQPWARNAQALLPVVEDEDNPSAPLRPATPGDASAPSTATAGIPPVVVADDELEPLPASAISVGTAGG